MNFPDKVTVKKTVQCNWEDAIIRFFRKLKRRCLCGKK